jgi:hypothetical protein
MPYKDKEQHKAWLNEYKQKQHQAYIEYKSKPCFDCGKSYPHYMMEFDHVRGKKSKNISSLSYRNFNTEKVQEELNKCDLICANCHSARTWFRSQTK